MGYEASMSTTGPVFLRPAMEIRERGWSTLQAKRRGAVWGKEGKRKQWRKGGSTPGRQYCPDYVLQPSRPFGTDSTGTSGLLCLLTTAYYHWQKGTKHLGVQEKLFLHIKMHVWCSLNAKSVYVFSIWEVLCNSVPSFAGHKANPWKSTDRLTVQKHVSSDSEWIKTLGPRKSFQHFCRLTPLCYQLFKQACAAQCTCCPHSCRKLRLHSITSKTICPVLRFLTSGL